MAPTSSKHKEVKKGKGCRKIILVMVVVLAFFVGYLLLGRRQKVFSPASTVLPVRETGLPVVKDEVDDWLTYEWEVIRFRYPPDWKVEKDYYRTPSQEEAGEPESVISLTLFSKDKPSDSDDSIRFGGRQTDCQILEGVPRCLTLFAIPIYTFSNNPAALGVYDQMVRTITYNNPQAAFQVLFPSSGNQLEVGKNYAIEWQTDPGLQIQKVKLLAFDASQSWQEGLALSVEDLPNTGSYEWTIPSTARAGGPYLISVSFCEPITPKSCQLHEGYSHPFYIDQ